MWSLCRLGRFAEYMRMFALLAGRLVGSKFSSRFGQWIFHRRFSSKGKRQLFKCRLWVEVFGREGAL